MYFKCCLTFFFRMYLPISDISMHMLLPWNELFFPCDSIISFSAVPEVVYRPLWATHRGHYNIVVRII